MKDQILNVRQEWVDAKLKIARRVGVIDGMKRLSEKLRDRSGDYFKMGRDDDAQRAREFSREIDEMVEEEDAKLKRLWGELEDLEDLEDQKSCDGG